MTTLFAQDEKHAGYARVVVERGIDRFPNGLTYAIPKELADLSPGERVVVPLGRGNTTTSGYVIEIADAEKLDADRIKPIRARDRSGIRLPEDLMMLARWLAGYYCTPLGMVLATVLPASVKRSVGLVTRRMVDVAPEMDVTGVRLTRLQRTIIETLQHQPLERPVEIQQLATLAGAKTITPIKRLLDKGVLTQTTKTAVEAVWMNRAIDPFIPESLTTDQASVCEAIGGELGRGFSAHLLFGITGSGKTEVYIRLIERCIAAGRIALVLVPEISLTPQTGGRLIGRFPQQRVAVLHSGLTAAQRHQQWALAARGDAEIILGARSAVFAAVPDDRLGLVIVDEEHDSSYKQDQLPRYHGRDVAVKRAQLCDCTVVLGSATPSLESWQNATARSTYRLHRLPARIPGATLPAVRVLDFREQMRERRRGGDRSVHLLGPVLESAIGKTLESGRQVLLFLNRRGYANYIACPDHMCGWVMACQDCDATMVYHVHQHLPSGGAPSQRGYVRCHHCLNEQRLPERCPHCARNIVTFGLGTQRVEEELMRKFPMLVEGQTLLRMDSDTMRTARMYHQALEQFAAGDVRMLVGTQMIAKGLDFPGVRLVGVVNADTAINLPDFRAAERTFQLVAQVAGRTGRADSAGRVIVQSFQPEAEAIQRAAAHDYEGFARQELRMREQFGLPPVTRMARIVVRDPDHETARTFADAIAREIAGRIEAGIEVRGPMPCPISRLAGHHRIQIEMTAATAGALQRLLTQLRNEAWIKADARTAIDVDPVSLL